MLLLCWLRELSCHSCQQEECNSGVLGAAFRAQEALGGSGDHLITDGSMTLVATPYNNVAEV